MVEAVSSHKIETLTDINSSDLEFGDILDDSKKTLPDNSSSLLQPSDSKETDFFDVSERIVKTAENTSVELLDAGINFLGDVGSGIYNYATDTDYIQETNNKIAQGTTQVINSIDNYLNEWGEKPEKPLLDIASLGIDTAKSVYQWTNNYQKASELGFGPEFATDSAVRAVPAIAGAAVSVFVPVTKVAKYIPGLEAVPQEMLDAVNSNELYIPDGAPNFDNRPVSNIDPFQQDFNTDIYLGLGLVDEFDGIANDRNSLFRMAHGAQDKKSIFAIHPDVDKTGLTQYLTLLGDSDFNKQEFSTIKFLSKSDGSYSPTFVYTSNSSMGVSVKRLDSFMDFTDSRMALGFHNHPSSFAAPSFSDSLQGIRSPYKSSLIGSAIRDENGKITDTQTIRWNGEKTQDYYMQIIKSGKGLETFDHEKYTRKEISIIDDSSTAQIKRYAPAVLGAGLSSLAFSTGMTEQTNDSWADIDYSPNNNQLPSVFNSSPEQAEQTSSWLDSFDFN